MTNKPVITVVEGGIHTFFTTSMQEAYNYVFGNLDEFDAGVFYSIDYGAYTVQVDLFRFEAMYRGFDAFGDLWVVMPKGNNRPIYGRNLMLRDYPLLYREPTIVAAGSKMDKILPPEFASELLRVCRSYDGIPGVPEREYIYSWLKRFGYIDFFPQNQVFRATTQGSEYIMKDCDRFGVVAAGLKAVYAEMEASIYAVSSIGGLDVTHSVIVAREEVKSIFDKGYRSVVIIKKDGSEIKMEDKTFLNHGY